MPDMTTQLCGVTLKNPVIAASGTFGFGREYAGIFDIGALGGISTKGLTLLPRLGNAAPRIAETASGMLNSVGLQNPGAAEFLRTELPFLRTSGTAVIANVSGATEDEYIRMCELLSVPGIDIIELNISCPNVKAGGISFGKNSATVSKITKAVRAACKKPLMVKLSPAADSISEAARAAEGEGADAVSLINTLPGMAVDARRRRPVLANIIGGLSGPCIKPVALRMVYEVSRAVSIPVVGMGGIMTGEDAAEFLLCGARAVQVGTATMARPDACINIIAELKEFLRQAGEDSVSAIVGALEV